MSIVFENPAETAQRVVNDTYIVSAGYYGKNLGVVQLEVSKDGAVELTDYQLIPIDETVEEDAVIQTRYKSK